VAVVHARFVYNARFTEQIVRTAQAVAVLERNSQPVIQQIENSIPVVTGSYKRSFDFKLSHAVDVAKFVVRIIIGEPRWHIIENGSVHNPPYRPLMRGCVRAGLRYERR